MNNEKIKTTNIAIIGAKEENIPLLNTLSGLKNFKVEVIEDYKQLANRKDISLVIETSGSVAFAKTLRSVASKEAVVLDREGAALLVELARERERLLKVETAYRLSEKYAEMIEETNRRLDEKVLELTLLNEASKTFSTAFDERNISSFVFSLLRRKIDFDACVLLVSDEEGENLILTSEVSLKEEIAQELKFRAAERFASFARRKIDVEKVPAVIEKAEGSAKKKDALEGPIQCFCASPLMVYDKILGLLAIAAVGIPAIPMADEQFLNILAGHVALFIENDRIRAQITAERNRLESILHSMVEGVMVIDEENKIILVNSVAEELLGINRSEVYGKQLTDAIAEEQIASLFDLLKRQKTGFLTKEVKMINSRDGLPQILMTGLSNIYNLSAETIGAVLVIHDITREKEVDRLKTEFISITSHELRTPLASIKQAIYLVLSQTVGAINEQQKKFLDIGKRNVDRLSKLINDLLDLSKIEAGKLKLERSEEDINHIAHEVVLTFEASAKERGLALEEKLLPDLAKFYFDPNKISQVVANLVSNAIKFTPAGGKITVASSYYGSDPNYIEISIKDSGLGIPKEDFDKLFKKFQQLDMALNRKTGGTGLGLAICKQIVELHGGRILAESEGRDKGSNFVFILPKEVKVMEETKKKRIMVIDDEKDLCDTVQATLQSKNYAVEAALSGQEGLDKIAQSKPDLIILDLMMPQMDGFAVAEKLKKNPEASQIPIIVLTALDQEESAKKALTMGAKGYLVKPFEPEALLFTLQEFLK
jgi:PAS domain S-box-containing protein